MRFILGVWLGRAGLSRGGVGRDRQEGTDKSKKKEPQRISEEFSFPECHLCMWLPGLFPYPGTPWHFLGDISGSRV